MNINEWFEVLKHGKFSLGDRVRKKGKGGSWQGHVCGFYSTPVTPIGYNVRSEREINSVQIYPESALELVPNPMESDAYWYARDHDRGPGAWCIRGKGDFYLPLDDKVLARAIALFMSRHEKEAASILACWEDLRDKCVEAATKI